ncbi:type II toxin-antitoxin system RelE/ParE family toxin [Dyadobacter sp. CY345]|uniref:type II toxin-antitoxin system RelE/ParE family toxin n=1 Tax=Dyadobacter sp. CY345 TaxID=2909335 RepID=UPI001F3B039D|nr:type II toxin-antitoxin system RelE/ParE family toxin [Dyadobacter sp. CY345]MCF2442669.1 type II toxin-antitoxin system RelE/ParE family toxin [Dyadobacter sp. CY345]
MSYKIFSISLFDKQAKRLAKKYPSLKQDLSDLILELAEKPNIGKPLGNNFYKVRLAINSKGKGKSGGARVITYIQIVDSTIFLTSIYDKSEKSSITSKELDQIFKLLN